MLVMMKTIEVEVEIEISFKKVLRAMLAVRRAGGPEKTAAGGGE